MHVMQIVLKKKMCAFSAVCLIGAAVAMFAGCSEGGRDYFETEGSGQAVDDSDTDRLGENGINNAEAEENAVDITFASSGGHIADSGELDATKDVLEKRLDSFGVREYEIDIDYSSGQIKLHCLASSMADDPEELSARLCEKAVLTFREGALFKLGEGEYIGNYEELPVALDGRDVEQAFAIYDEANKEYAVLLEFNDMGTEKFSEVTKRLSETHSILSIYMDDEELCRPVVTCHIPDGQATIGGGFTAESAKELADKINCGSLPFDIEVLKINTDF